MLWHNWLKRQQLNYNRYLVNKFFANLETRGGIINGRSVLFVYNDQHPELSYILSEAI